ncbi:TetR/AcrR family transcriptional regulator [Streptomyces sp. NPDC091280]|uniref:TetR/AcrR family transcriptional regulator n=1 Tax=Streptomyces sp. NPDC091280 TaxID=3365984 RepID=UPI0038017A13
MAKAGPRSDGGSRGARGSAETRAALVAGAVTALREKGYAGASAREIARNAGCNQSLVFYHFGTVVDLLLAALDHVSDERSLRYREAVERSGSLGELIHTARTVFDEDLDKGYVTVLVEMIAGAQSTPGLGAEVAARIGPWRDFTTDVAQDVLSASPLALLLPAREVAHTVVALYLGLEMLASLDGDRDSALALFDRAGLLAVLADAYLARQDTAPDA